MASLPTDELELPKPAPALDSQSASSGTTAPAVGPSPDSLFGKALALLGPAPAPAPFTPAPYDEANSVENRTARIAASGSPLMQRAETLGAQAAAKRGLTNSSIGIESIGNSIMAAAVPIATADAGLATQTQNVNTQVQAAASMQGVDIAQKMRELETQREQFAQSLGMTAKDLDLRRDTLTQQQQQFLQSLDVQKQQLTQQESQFGRSLSANQQNFQAELAQRDTLAKLDADTRMKLGQMDTDSRMAIQGSVNIGNAWNQMMANIQAIQNNPNLEEPAKKTLIENNMQAFRSFSAFWQKLQNGQVDNSDLLNFAVATAPTAAPAPVGGGGAYNPFERPYEPPGGA